MKTITFKTPAARTVATVAACAALSVLSAHAGLCGDINPQPLPPAHHLPMVVAFVSHLLHALRILF